MSNDQPRPEHPAITPASDAPEVSAVRARAAAAVEIRPNEARRFRTRALWAGLLLMPATVVAGVLGLMSENAGRCVGYGEGCSDTPGWVYLTALAVAAAAWIHALCTPDGDSQPAPGRKAAFWTMIGAECVFLLLVVTYFG
ncbi:hypothetical protein [Streptomyces sp. NPDC093600]|uniref:hypothetical protein n=1 Tax=Streptomyces sp. NPDC093600 TaxID=3366047 RepID=UPI003826F8BA